MNIITSFFDNFIEYFYCHNEDNKYLHNDGSWHYKLCKCPEDCICSFKEMPGLFLNRREINKWLEIPVKKLIDVEL